MTVKNIHHDVTFASCLTWARGIEKVKIPSTAHPIVMLDNPLSQVQVVDR